MDLLGKNVADKITEEISSEALKLRDRGIIPKLAILKVGNRPDDESYQKGALSRCEKCNIDTEVVALDENVDEAGYIKALEKLNNDKDIHGILCFRPLPKGIDEDKIKYIIDEHKDVDAFSPINIAKLVSGDQDGFNPCTPQAVIEILDFYDIDLCGKNVVVLGRSMVVGKPLSMLLLNRNATVTVCHSKTKGIKEISKSADILISCMGRAKMVDREFVSDGQVIVDVGINFTDDGKMCGDVDYESVVDVVNSITPVPRGVGSATSSVLAKQVLKACKLQNGID